MVDSGGERSAAHEAKVEAGAEHLEAPGIPLRPTRKKLQKDKRGTRWLRDKMGRYSSETYSINPALGKKG